MDVLLLAAAGIAAALAGGLTLLLAPGKTPTLLAGVALMLLGIVQFGFARVALEASWGGHGLWLRHSITLALPTTTLWALLSATLGRAPGARLSRRWGAYLVVQTLVAAAALAWSALAPEPPEPIGSTLSLETTTRIALFLILVNVTIFTVNFEATYFSLARRERRAFRPALAGIMLCSIFYASLCTSGILGGRAASSDLALGAVPVAALSLLVPISFVRRRLGAVKLAPHAFPATATNSLPLAGTFLVATLVLFGLTQMVGMKPARSLWVLATGIVILAVLAFAISNRARRRLERLVAPLWSDWRVPYRRSARRGVAPLERCRTLEDLCRSIPANAQRLSGFDEVTLLLSHRPSKTFQVVASTIAPAPSASVLEQDPLAQELRRARRPIRLDGRPDDLEYVSIYVENRPAIEACRARVAVPLMGEADMIGVLLCGARADSIRLPRRGLAILSIASRLYASMIEKSASAPPANPLHSPGKA